MKESVSRSGAPQHRSIRNFKTGQKIGFSFLLGVGCLESIFLWTSDAPWTFITDRKDEPLALCWEVI